MEIQGLTGSQRLAAAVLERASLDIDDRHVFWHGHREERDSRAAAWRWARDAGAEFRFWCDVAGLEWREVQREFLVGEKPASTAAEPLAGSRSAAVL